LFKSIHRFQLSVNPAVVQRPERLNVDQEVGGSIPSPGTIPFVTRMAHGEIVAFSRDFWTFTPYVAAASALIF
jgi:hypothetical protein